MTAVTSSNCTVQVGRVVDVALVVKAVRDLIEELALDEISMAQIATAASELATNIVKYAGLGTVELSTGEADSRLWVAIVAKDNGPGIADTELALQEHYTTGGSLGLGLPGVRRLMDEFHIQTAPGEGCTITSRKWFDGW